MSDNNCGPRRLVLGWLRRPAVWASELPVNSHTQSTGRPDKVAKPVRTCEPSMEPIRSRERLGLQNHAVAVLGRRNDRIRRLKADLCSPAMVADVFGPSRAGRPREACRPPHRTRRRPSRHA